MFDVSNWEQTATLLSSLTEQFPDVRVVDVGGGLGVPERADQPGVDLAKLDAALATGKAAFPKLELWMEPGRYFVASAGVLIARVTQLKSKGSARYVGVATGMNSLIRPALYGAYHEITNLTRADDPATELVNIVGPICESADVLGHDRLLPPTREGDILLIANAGIVAVRDPLLLNELKLAGEAGVERHEQDSPVGGIQGCDVLTFRSVFRGRCWTIGQAPP